MKRGFFLSAAVAVLVAAGGAALCSGGYLYAKAQAGQWLMHRAWTRTQASGHPSRPWPWADTQPLARLIVPAQRVDLLVLAGASGRTLAWGPAPLDHAAALGAPGNAVISAHRDTHFRFLAHVALGDALIVERADASRVVYRVREIRVMDARTLALPRDTERPTLTLITCYPFDALLPGGPLRYVVTAEAERGPSAIEAYCDLVGTVGDSAFMVGSTPCVWTSLESRDGRLLPVRYSLA